MKEIKNFPEYKITENGEVFGPKGKLLKHTIVNGYHRVSLKGKTKRVHRLVAEAYIPNTNDLDYVDHKDENKNNNHKDNLQWLSSRDNTSRSKAQMYCGNVAKKVKVDTKEFQSIKKASEYLSTTYNKNIHTVSRELRRILKGVRKGKIYGHSITWD